MNDLTPNTRYHLIMNKVHQQANFLGTQTERGLEYWFEGAAAQRFCIRAGDPCPIFTDTEWQDRAWMSEQGEQIETQANLCHAAGITAAECNWVRQNHRNSKLQLLFILGSIAKWRKQVGNIHAVQTVVGAGIEGETIFTITNSALKRVQSNHITDQQAQTILTKYLTGAQRSSPVIKFFTSIGKLSLAQAQTFLGHTAMWLNNMAQMDLLLEGVLAVPGIDRGLQALAHTHYIFETSQTLLEMLAHAPNVDFNTLQWVASENRPSGNSAQQRADNATFIHSYSNNASYADIAQKIVRDMAQTGAARTAIHDYVTSNGTINNTDTLDQRFIAIRKANGNQANAGAGLAASYTQQQAQQILLASQVPRKHIADNSVDAYNTAKYRGEGTTSNSCTISGVQPMIRELHRVMVHYRAEIHQTANGQTTRLMTLPVQVNENLWFRNGNAGVTPQFVTWRSLEVVIAKQGNGNLTLVHCQPNA